MEQNEERATHVVYEKDEHGQIVIADEVVAIIAGIAATEVKGVDSMYGGWSGEIISRMGIRDLSKGVSISIEDGHVSVKLSLNVRYGYSIPDVSRNVQDKVTERRRLNGCADEFHGGRAVLCMHAVYRCHGRNMKLKYSHR